jgi:ABC-type dipeptide/oligopeptide/nickel transport system permease component
VSRYIVRRLVLALVTLWALATLGFLLVEAIPGDPARQLAGPTASVETVEAIRHAYGFDQPAWDRYVATLERYGHFDLGYSFSRSENARSVIARDVGHTLTLTLFAFVGELLIGIPLAVLVTSRKGRLADGSLVAAAGAPAALRLRVPPRVVPARGNDRGMEVLRPTGPHDRDPVRPGVGEDPADVDAR